MDGNKINSQISKARELYDKTKYEKALSIIESISESDILNLGVEQQFSFTLLQSLIYLKLERYYVSKTRYFL